MQLNKLGQQTMPKIEFSLLGYYDRIQFWQFNFMIDLCFSLIHWIIVNQSELWCSYFSQKFAFAPLFKVVNAVLFITSKLYNRIWCLCHGWCNWCMVSLSEILWIMVVRFNLLLHLYDLFDIFRNIFIRANRVKIGDFGISRILMGSADMASTFVGTPFFMSPEVLKHEGYNSKSDVWCVSNFH